MRPEILYLTDIVDAAEAIARFLTGVEREAFLKDELRQSGVQGTAAVPHPDSEQPLENATLALLGELGWQNIS